MTPRETHPSRVERDGAQWNECHVSPGRDGTRLVEFRSAPDVRGKTGCRIPAVILLPLMAARRLSRYKYHYLDTTPLHAIVKRWLKPGRKGGEE